MTELAGVTETLFTNTESNRACYQAVVDAYQQAEKLFASFDEESKPKWKKVEANVWEHTDPRIGHLFCHTFHVHASPEKVFNDFQNIDTDSAWSPRLNSRKIVGYLGEQSEIIYRMQSSIISASSRDLVCARMWRDLGTNRYMIVSRSGQTELAPSQANIQRVDLKMFAIRISPILLKHEECIVDFLSDGEAKGWLSSEDDLHYRATKLKGVR